MTSASPSVASLMERIKTLPALAIFPSKAPNYAAGCGSARSAIPSVFSGRPALDRGGKTPSLLGVAVSVGAFG